MRLKCKCISHGSIQDMGSLQVTLTAKSAPILCLNMGKPAALANYF